MINNFAANSTSFLVTQGDLSDGILAQSIGGGGGNGGFSVSGSGSINKAVNANSTGGGAGTGNFAGNVTVQSGGEIVTGVGNFVGGQYEGAISGEGSIGILAQSIGGGGGNGGFSGALSFSNGGAAATNSTGGAGGTGSDGKLVTVDTALGSAIATYGDNAAGILAQSVGGGGGNGGFSIGAGVGTGSDASGSSNTVGGNGSGGGQGGAVNVANEGTITDLGPALRRPDRAIDRRRRRQWRLCGGGFLQPEGCGDDQHDRRHGERRRQREHRDRQQFRGDFGQRRRLDRHFGAIGRRRRRRRRIRGRPCDQRGREVGEQRDGRSGRRRRQWR